MQRIIAALVAAMPCAVLAQGDIGVRSPFTLDQAIAEAGGNAPSVEAAQAGILAAQAGRAVAGLRPNPTFQSQIENVTGSGPYKGFDQAETTVGLNIPVELGGKRSARIAVADAQTDRALLGEAIAQAELRLQVTLLYVEAVAADRRAGTTRELLDIAAEALRGAKVRTKAGRASPIEEQRAEIVRLNAEANVERTQRLADAARVNLARRVGHPIQGALDTAILDRIDRAAYGPPANAGDGTLMLAAADADLTVAEAGVRVARSQRVPDVTIGPAVRRLEVSGDTAAVFSVSIPVPLFGSGRAAVAQAEAERKRTAAQRRMTALDIEQAITDARAEADNAATIARNASGPALVAALEAARIARIGYREGKFGQLDLIDAERTLAETRLAAIDALATYQNAKARLERLIAPAPRQGH